MGCNEVFYNIDELKDHLISHHNFTCEEWMDFRYLQWVHQQIIGGD